MIVRQRPDGFTLVAQHDHAQLSGWFASMWGNDRVPALPAPRQALCLAAALHDVGWLDVDQAPPWNETERRPYSFVDLPSSLRFPAYRAGIDRVEAEDPYAALLCSLHYTSFFLPGSEAAAEPGADAFVAAEQERQARLVAALRRQGRSAEVDRAASDLALLKLWDNLSLYVALNEPGVSKEREHPWYRHGFPPVTLDATGTAVRFRARWLDERHIAVDPFPLRDELAYALPFRVVGCLDGADWDSAYRSAPVLVQVIVFVPDPERGGGHAEALDA
ncbi:MAG: DUF3891 family protein [Clostridia bacterium]|nr:DUF3891 family protein [Clostridia bacterium]